MAACLAVPHAALSDEAASIMESTAVEVTDHIGPRKGGTALPEISFISPGLENPARNGEETDAVKQDSAQEDGGRDRVRVYLRIRPLIGNEDERGEEQGCVCVQDKQTLVLRAPRDSFNMKSSDRGVSQSKHCFTFTQIFGPETGQQEFFESTMKEAVWDVLRGDSRLLYTYGVTNSGKTYTVQGTGREPGLLPRTLVALFQKLGARLYPTPDLKPVLCQEVRWLSRGEVRAEEIRRDALLSEAESPVSHNSRLRGDSSTSSDSGIGGLSMAEDSASLFLDANSLSGSGAEGLPEGVRFSIWVSFFEIYNEFLYDLLGAPSPRKRATLRLCEDRNGQPYVRDLTWVQVRNAEEAWKVLKVGRRNQSLASTHLNHSSSRSHSIFSIRLLHVPPDHGPGRAPQISELCVCDLAGSERCKEQRDGERLKEASSINTSLHTLGRCIAALRYNQACRSRPPLLVPFRDSKLTRVLQGFFCGRGRSCMVVNINPCASSYDETLHGLKFSALATELVHVPSTKTRVAYILSLLQESDRQANMGAVAEEEEEEDCEEDEADLSMFDCEALLRAIEVLKAEVHRQRREKEELEARVREQVCSEMMEVIRRMQDDFGETLEAERALLEEKHEEKVSNLQTSLRKYYMQEMEERDEQIQELTAELQGRRETKAFPGGPDPQRPRRSLRLASTGVRELGGERCQAVVQEEAEGLKKCSELLTPPPPSSTINVITVDRKLEDGQKNLRQLRADLQRLGQGLQEAEHACCHKTGGAQLRGMLAAAEEMLGKQNQALLQIQRDWQLVKADLRQKTESLSSLQRGAPTATGCCRKRSQRGVGSDPEDQRHGKKPFLYAASRDGTPARSGAPSGTPHPRILRARQPSPPPSPSVFKPRVLL
ncbi:kinesin-like protein KIF20A isoform X2 [Brienomyrus brachyistius]|uniref:kinesin-like protein KIF20A isoform X2 n=1 Tax=Brienomyrus brachyistius TaxID=42636 RepID=UPI0020B3ACB0|nr:kinesin-like protein KIF20A isoform X2 [Brienomyrus brachyistius]